MPITPDVCATRLETLAADHRFKPRQDDLTDLATSIRTADGAWGGVDLQRAFPAGSSIRTEATDGVDQVLSLMSLVTVFLPLAWTWWSFSGAVSAYRGSSWAGSFFDGWTSGFGGRLATPHRLGPMALISLGLILVTVVVAVMHRRRSIAAIRREEVARAAAAAELASVLFHAQQICQDQRATAAATVDRSIRTVVGALKRIQRAAAQTAGLFETNVDRLEKSLPTVSMVLDQARSEVTKIIDDGQTRSADLMARAAEPVSDGAAKMSEAAERLEKVVDGLASAVATTASLATSVDGFEDVVGRLDQSVALNAGAMQAQVSELTATRAAVVALLRDLDVTAAAMPDDVPESAPPEEEAG